MRVRAALVTLAGGVVSASMTRAGVSGLSVPAVDNDKQSIVRALNDSIAGWNSRNLDRFIRIYEDSPDTTFVQQRGMIRGFAAIRRQYAARFAPTAAHDTLSLQIMEVDVLDANYALLIGRYRLKEGRKLQGEGQTTLLLHRSAPGWRIISDHSC